MDGSGHKHKSDKYKSDKASVQRYKRGTLEAARLGTNADERAASRRNARRNTRKKPPQVGRSSRSPIDPSPPPIESHRAELVYGLPRATYESLPKGYQRGVRTEWRDEEEARRVAKIKVRMVRRAAKRAGVSGPADPAGPSGFQGVSGFQPRSVREAAERFGLDVGLGAKPDRASWLALADMGLLDLRAMRIAAERDEEEREKRGEKRADGSAARPGGGVGGRGKRGGVGAAAGGGPTSSGGRWVG